MSNWPLNDNRASSNWTGRTARRFDGRGGFADDSHDIPRSAWFGAVAAVGALFALYVIGAYLF
jgi:hypothetical protein